MFELSIDQIHMERRESLSPHEEEIVHVLRIVLERHGLQTPLAVHRRADGTYDVVWDCLLLYALQEQRPDMKIPCELADVRDIPLDMIGGIDDKARTSQSAEKLSALKESIKREGLPHPIVVRLTGSRYFILDGMKRAIAWQEVFPEKPIPCAILAPVRI